MNGLDDQDVFISTEDDEIEQIELGYKVSKIVIMVFGAGICAIELLLTLQIIVNHW